MADVIRPYIGKRVMEVGAGTGNMSVHLMPRSVYWATDVNAHYLAYLNTVAATRPYMRVGYANAMEGDSYPRGQAFDTIVALNVVEHLEDDIWRCKTCGTAWKKAGARSFWFPAARGCMEAWTKCWDITGATRRSGWLKWRSRRDSKWSEC